MKITKKLNKIDLKRIKLLILDIDGVLSDGRIIYDSQGNDYRIFYAQDGYGVRLAIKAGIRVVFMSGRHSVVINRRARDLGVEDVYQNVQDKTEVLKELLAKYRLKAEQACAIGDDTIDLPLLKKAGVGIAVSNAIPALKKAARYVTKLQGGNGAVREVINLILEAKLR